MGLSYLREDLEFWKMVVELSRAIGEYFIENSNHYINRVIKEKVSIQDLWKKPELMRKRRISEDFADGFNGWFTLKLLPRYGEKHPELQQEINNFIEECYKPAGIHAFPWQAQFLQLEKKLGSEKEVINYAKKAGEKEITELLYGRGN